MRVLDLDMDYFLECVPSGIGESQISGDFDFALLAQSPNYTPASADFIMDIFREYIEEI